MSAVRGAADPADQPSEVERARVVVTVGTDHHRFDRLTDWLEPWVVAHPDVPVLHQHGTSRPVPGARAVTLVPRRRMLALQEGADVVVAQGGPGSVVDARRCGRVPIVVPRLAGLREVVDDHQLHFSRRMADIGWVHLVEDAQALAAALDRALSEPEAFRCPPHESPAPRTAQRVHEVLDDVRTRRPGTVAWRRVRTTLARSGGHNQGGHGR